MTWREPAGAHGARAAAEPAEIVTGFSVLGAVDAFTLFIFADPEADRLLQDQSDQQSEWVAGYVDGRGCVGFPR